MLEAPADECTSGSGHNGSVIFATSAGRKTSIFTSWAMFNRLPTRLWPLISNENTACSCFFASFITKDSCSTADCTDDAAERRAPRSASVDMDTVISLFAFDWIRYASNKELTFIFLQDVTLTLDSAWEGDLRPKLDPSFVRFVIAYNLHRCLCELDYTSFL